MMKRRIIKSIILLGLVCITGCGEIKNNKGEEKTSASESSLFQMVEKKDYSEETINLDGKVSDDVLCETLEKKDASQQASYNSLNRMCSFVVENNQKSLFCIDDVTGAVYFVNQYRDWYIYRLWEGKAELAVALPAKELYMWDGTLYFMAESYGLYDLENISDGDIFAYTPKEGVVELVYAAGETMKEEKSSLAKNSQKMTVSETGVHFIGDIKTKMIEYEGMKLMSKEETPYSLLFGTKEPIEDSYNMTKAGWGITILE